MADLQDGNKLVTLRDVARSVGVNVATASAVLNQTRSGTRVSEKTRTALLAAAQTMGYRPNEVARSLARRRTKLIGFFARFEFLSSRNAFLSELVGGMQEAASLLEYDLVLHTVPEGTPVPRAVATLADRRVDGLLFFAPEEPALLPELRRTGLPIVCVVDHCPGSSSVTADDFGGGARLARHLAEKGHRRVLYRDWHLQVSSVVARREGFQSEARRRGMDVILGERVVNVHAPHFTEAEVALLREERHPVTAVACWEDTTASRTCEVLEGLGFEIPNRMAVTGFNGTQLAELVRYPLTTIRAPWREVGAQSVRRLLALVNDEPIPEWDTLPVEFLPGGTA